MATVLITAGPTREHLDAVRYLTNASTGRMGLALAAVAQRAGHRVRLVLGPTELVPPARVETARVVSALDMLAAVERWLPEADLVFGVAAVSDYRPAQRHPGKPPKGEAALRLELVPNPDILAEVGSRPGRRAVVGFALEALGPDGMAGVLLRARAKLIRKRLDAIAVNLDSALGAPRSQVVVLRQDGSEERLPDQDKDVTAERLLAIGIELWQQKQR